MAEAVQRDEPWPQSNVDELQHQTRAGYRTGKERSWRTEERRQKPMLRCTKLHCTNRGMLHPGESSSVRRPDPALPGSTLLDSVGKGTQAFRISQEPEWAEGLEGRLQWFEFCAGQFHINLT